MHSMRIHKFALIEVRFSKTSTNVFISTVRFLDGKTHANDFKPKPCNHGRSVGFSKKFWAGKVKQWRKNSSWY